MPTVSNPEISVVDKSLPDTTFRIGGKLDLISQVEHGSLTLGDEALSCLAVGNIAKGRVIKLKTHRQA